MSRGRLTFIATGSRGDVQPQVALARRFQDEGFSVRFATHRCFSSLLAAANLEHFPLSGDSERFFSGTAGVAFRERLADRDKALDLCRRFLSPFVRIFLTECTEAARDSDALFYWPPCQVGPSLAQAMGVPCIGVATYPLPHCRTAEFANPFAEPTPVWLEQLVSRIGFLRGFLNRYTWSRGEPIWRQIFHEEVMAWRQNQLGLPIQTDLQTRRELTRIPHLFGFSPQLLPPPRDWAPHLHVTGFWFLNLAAEWQPPAELVSFLAEGPPPIAIGFGSMVVRDSTKFTSTVMDAVQRAGIRAVLLQGWGGLRKVAAQDHVYHATDVPHDWLYPRVAAVVHHGGSGTTAAGLRAGIPALVVPFGFDQDLWGQRIAVNGIGPEPIPCHRLDAAGLADSLKRLVEEPDFRKNAARMSQLVRAEDGCGRAVEVTCRTFGL